MRYLIPMMVGAVAFLLSAAFAQEHTVRLNGQVRFMTTAGEEAARYMSFQNAVTLRKEPPKGVKLPAWANSSCRYGSLKLGKPPQEWHVLVELGGARAVVDANRNADFTDDEVLQGTADALWYYGTQFGPFRLSVPVNGRQVARYFVLFTDDMDRGRLFLRSEDYRLFEGEVDGKAIQMVVIDSNADGVFDTYSRRHWEGDACLFPPDRERCALPRYRQIGNRYYRLTLASDGSFCELTPSDLQLATVLVDYSHVKLEAVGKEVGYWEASTEDGRLQMPADEYSVISYTFGMRNDKGEQWAVSVTPMDPVALKVAAGENRFPLPKQLSATLDFGTRQGDTLNVALMLYAGSRVHQVSSVERNGELPPPPSLRIVDRNGKTVKVEKFHYG